MAKEEKTQKNGGGYGWIVVSATFVIMFMIDGVLNSFGVLLVGLMEDLHGSTVSVAGIGGTFLGFIAISSPFAGSLSDTFCRRNVTLVGTIIFSCGLLASAFVPNVALLYLTYSILGGTGYGLMITPPLACVFDHFKGRKRGIACGLALCGSGFGSFVLSLTTKYFLDAYSSRGTFLLLSGIMLNGIPCALLLRSPHRLTEPGKEHSISEIVAQENSSENTNENHRAISSESVIEQHQSDTTENRKPLGIKYSLKTLFVNTLFVNNITIFRDFQCFCFLMATFLFGFAYFVPFTFLPKQAIAMNMGKDNAAWLSSVLGISGTVGRFVTGWLGHRYFIRPVTLLKILLLCMAISFPVSLVLTTFKTKLVFAAVCGFLIGGFTVLMPLALADVVSAEKVGKANGLFVCMVAGASVIGAPLTGWTIDVTDDFVVCFSFAGVATFVAMMILSLPAARTMWCSRRSNSDESTNL